MEFLNFDLSCFGEKKGIVQTIIPQANNPKDTIKPDSNAIYI